TSVTPNSNGSLSDNQLNQIDFGNTGNDLDPDEIESITVLTGPAATALYGERGSKGAVMITTKKGKNNKTLSKVDVTFKTVYTQSDILKYADMQHMYGQGNVDIVADDRRENFSWGRPFDGQMRPWGQVIDGKQLVKPYVDQPNNIKSFFDHGKNITNYLTLSGGDDKTNYMLTLNTLNSTGVVPNTFYNRYSVRFNGATQLTNHIYTSINFNYLNTYARVEGGGQSDGSVLNYLYQTPRDIPVWELKDYNNKYYSMEYTDTSGVQRYGYYGAYTKNPYWVAKNYDNRNKSDRILGDYVVGYKRGSFNVFNRLGGDISTDRSTYKTPKYNSEAVDAFYSGLNQSSAGGYTQYATNRFSMYNDLIANFTHSLGENFGIDAVAGNNVTINQSEILGAIIDPSSNGLVLPNVYTLNNNQGPVTAINNLNRERRVGVYVDLKFNYQRELFLELTGRNDWSSTLAFGHNSYFYPGANASWVFTEKLNNTNFKKKVLNYGKVRASIVGIGGGGVPYINNAAGYTQSGVSSSFGTVTPPFNGIPAYQIQSTFGSESLRPERTVEFEMGTDLSFLNDRLSGSFTYYSNRTRDLNTLAPIPTSTGYAAHYINLGTVTNKGIEVTLRGTPIQTKWGLKWELFGTYTKNVNNVESLNSGLEQVNLGGFNGMSIVAAVGKPLGTFYAADIKYWNGHAVVDANGIPVPTDKPVYRGSYQPKFIASWGTDVSWKGFTLHCVFVTKQGTQFYSRTKSIMDFVGTAQETTVNDRRPYVWNNSVQQYGTTNNYVTNTTPFSPYNYWTNYVGSEKYPAQNLVNGSYVRLQELSLNYRIPSKYYKRSPFGSLEAGVFGNNLILWTATSNKYEDPEQTSAGAASNGQGFNYTSRPSLRNYGISLKATF
ncbi:MAG: SusC/RagA family TonB-linked outer membrane protein, partial [Chitinophagia bacterium]|nr:SusC/RagA family TonB-linked outer membrane protein [Chitinophagia bacterium]